MPLAESNQNTNKKDGGDGDGLNQGPSKSVSPQKLAANRRHAERSTGPRTAEGKSKSARNAYKHGFFALKLFIPGEEAGVEGQTSLELGKQIWAYYKPVGCLEELLVEKIVCESVRYTRLLHHEHEQFIAHHGFSERVLRYQAAINRQLFQAIERLEQLQAKRKAQPVGPESDPEGPADADENVPVGPDHCGDVEFEGEEKDICGEASGSELLEAHGGAVPTTGGIEDAHLPLADILCSDTSSNEPELQTTVNYGTNPPRLGDDECLTESPGSSGPESPKPVPPIGAA